MVITAKIHQNLWKYSFADFKAPPVKPYKEPKSALLAGQVQCLVENGLPLLA